VNEDFTVLTSWTRGQRAFVSIPELSWDMSADKAMTFAAMLVAASEECREAEQLDATQA
jgi:hypothetical protein